MKRIGILGAGAWGTAVAQHLADNGHPVLMWCNEPDVAESISTRHTNRFLPDNQLNKKIQATKELAEFFDSVDFIFEAVPVRYLELVLQRAQPFIKASHSWIVMSKGVYQGFLIDDILNRFPAISEKNRAALVGPNFAREVVCGDYSETLIAGPSGSFLKEVQSLVANDHFVVHTSSDYRGVLAASAYKNVVALAVGIARGAGFHENACAALITQGLTEVAAVVKFFGGQEATTYSLAGVGDLVLTTAGTQSRNVSFGVKVGSGETIDSLMKQGVERSEGVATAESLMKPLFSHLALPLCRQVGRILFEGHSPRSLIPLPR